MSFSFKNREEWIRSLTVNPPELLIIGGGVVGASIAAHAARLGLNVVLTEKADLASGASGNSTGLAHAGLRYLAQGRIGYVFREGRERQRLQELAPHWVRPFHFVLPVYKGDPYSFWMVRLGTWIYDALGWCDAILSRRPLVKRHSALSAEAVRAKIPGIRTEGLEGGLEYYVDARLQDARFTMGYAQQAAAHGARIITHMEATSVAVSEEGQPGVFLRDVLGGQTLQCSPALVINATGAWIDDLRHGAGMGNKVVQKSKGVHLIVDHVSDSPLILSGSAKGKVFFVIPIDSERTLVGTTDTSDSRRVEDACPDERDITELLQQLLYFFPYLKQGANLMEAMAAYRQVHVRDVYWGVRPLLAQEGSTSSASREHLLVKDMPRFWSFPGVKLTAGRAAGYEAAVSAWKLLRAEAPLPAVSWDSLPGGELWDFEQFVYDAQRRFNLGPNSHARIVYLISLYGTRYVEVLQWAQKDPALNEPIVPEEPWILAQVAYAVQEEMVLTLGDLLWRRVKWAHYRDLPESALRQICAILAPALSWSNSDIQKQLQDYQVELKKHRLPA